MVKKNLLYISITLVVLVVFALAGAFTMLKINEKPNLVVPLYKSTTTIAKPVIKKTIETVVTEPKSDQVNFKLPENLPISVIKKHTFDSQTKFEKPLISTISNYKLPVLMYHHIDSGASIAKNDLVGYGLRVGPKIFEKQLMYIQEKGYKTINSDDLYAFMEFGVALPDKPILLTFDDGYKDNVEQALPILQKYKMIADFGIVTGVVGTGEYMNWEDHKILLKAGNSISSHTVNHCYLAVNVNSASGVNGPFKVSPVDDTPNQLCPSFTFGGQLNTGQIRGELSQSKLDLEKILNIKVHFVIYPFGKYNVQVIQIAKEVGYTMATSVEPQVDDNVDLANEPFQIHRVRMHGQQTGEIVKFLD